MRKRPSRLKLELAVSVAAVTLLVLFGVNASHALEGSSLLYATKIYDTQLSPEDASWIASRSDLVVISGVGDRYVKQMKAENPELKVFRYFTVCLISSGSYPNYNVIGYEEVNREHPDWFLLDSKGKKLHPEPKLYGMDPAAKGWPQYWLKQVVEVVSSRPYDGVHGDLAHTDIGRIVPEAKHRYPREEEFHRVQERFLGALHRGLNREGKLLLLNNVNMGSSTDPDYLINTRLENCDGFNQQAVVMRWRNHPEDRFVGPRRLERSMKVFDQAARRQKIVMLGMQPSPERPQEISYCVGCYLLVKNDPWVYLNIDWGGKYEYMRKLFDKYGDVINVDYGVPLEPRYKDRNLWKRRYSKGTVVVDPVAHTFDFIPQPTR